MTPEYIEARIKIFENYLNKFNSLFNEQEKKLLDIQSLKTGLSDIQKLHDEFSSQIAKKFNTSFAELNEKVRANDADFHDIAVKIIPIPEIYDLWKRMQQRVDAFDEKLADLMQSKFKSSDLNEVHQRIDSICKVINETRDELKNDQKYLGEIVRQEINKFVDLHNSSLKESILNIIKDFENDKKQLMDKIEESKNAFFKETASLREELSTKFNLLSQKKEDPKPAPSIDQALNNKIESYAIDVNNAHLKINNFDVLMKIMDKKIETLSLLMKKLDLSKG